MTTTYTIDSDQSDFDEVLQKLDRMTKQSKNNLEDYSVVTRQNFEGGSLIKTEVTYSFWEPS